MTKDEQLDALRVENVRLTDENARLKAKIDRLTEALDTANELIRQLADKRSVDA